MPAAADSSASTLTGLNAHTQISSSKGSKAIGCNLQRPRTFPLSFKDRIVTAVANAAFPPLIALYL